MVVMAAYRLLWTYSCWWARRPGSRRPGRRPRCFHRPAVATAPSLGTGRGWVWPDIAWRGAAGRAGIPTSRSLSTVRSSLSPSIVDSEHCVAVFCYEECFSSLIINVIHMLIVEWMYEIFFSVKVSVWILYVYCKKISIIQVIFSCAATLYTDPFFFLCPVNIQTHKLNN